MTYYESEGILWTREDGILEIPRARLGRRRWRLSTSVIAYGCISVREFEIRIFCYEVRMPLTDTADSSRCLGDFRLRCWWFWNLWLHLA